MAQSTEAIGVMVDRILKIPHTFDPSTRLPLVVVDSKGLEELKTERWPLIVQNIIKRLPQCDYALIFFASGAPSKPSWSWISKTYNMLGRDIKKRVKRVYIVHESWWIRTITEMFRGIVSSKFRKKLVHLSSLSQLAQHLDITLIDIPPHVYLHNLKIEAFITIPKHSDPVFGQPVHENGQLCLPQLWIDLVNYLHTTGPNTRGIFCKTELSDLVYILKDCYDRNQLLSIDDYGPLQAASLLKLYIYELPTPVLPIETISLPMESTVEYCVNVMKKLSYSSKVILMSLLDLLSLIIDNKHRTFQSPVTMANSVATCLIGRQSSDKNHIKICTRFLTIALENWSMIGQQLNDKRQSKTIKRGQNASPTLEPVGVPTRNVSTPNLRQKHESEEFDSKRSISETGTSRVQSRESPVKPKSKMDLKPTPPPPRMTKSIPELGKSKVLQPSKVTNIDAEVPKDPEPKSLHKQATIRRGKIVAELAAFYEENADTASDLVKKEQETWKNAKGITDTEKNEVFK